MAETLALRERVKHLQEASGEKKKDILDRSKDARKSIPCVIVPDCRSNVEGVLRVDQSTWPIKNLLEDRKEMADEILPRSPTCRQPHLHFTVATLHVIDSYHAHRFTMLPSNIIQATS
ncbi:uncharacterized protein J3R85_015669 [Psidium guajava]|nr:uncharacterized protein J3R85_015669 [Psidium guajava]